MKKVLTIVLVFAFSAALMAQPLTANRQKLISLQDSLKSLGFKMVNSAEEPVRYNASYLFIRTLVEALKTPNSYSFPFDSVKTVSIQPSGDGTFRIFSWQVQNDDGSFRYYGTIQMNKPDGKLQMFPLVDYSPFMKNPADTVTTNEAWYGAQYYKVIPVTRNVKSPYYVLLGWKGNTARSTKKVIDVLSFRDGKAYFGMPVFDGDKKAAAKKRVIFEYTRQASMTLNYQPKEGLIVFDHLAPPDAKLEGKFETYGPDMTYDGFKFVNGRWVLTQDLQLRNEATDQDDNFNDPRKPIQAKPRQL